MTILKVAEKPPGNLAKRLKAAGFTAEPTEGSHTFWVDPNGAAVSIPDGHKTISPGVVRKVNKAIEASKQ